MQHQANCFLLASNHSFTKYLLFKVFNKIFVDLHTEVLHCCLAVRQHYRRGVVWELPFRFGVAVTQSSRSMPKPPLANLHEIS